MSQALKEIKRPLHGGTLVITQFAVLRAIRVGARVAKTLSPVVGGLGKGLNLDDVVGGKIKSMLAGGEIDLNRAVPGALNAIAEHLDPDDFVSLCQDLLQSSYWVDSTGGSKIDLSQPGGIDLAFNGDIPELFGALRGVMEANNFFGLSAIGRLRGALGAQKTQSPEASIQT